MTTGPAGLPRERRLRKSREFRKVMRTRCRTGDRLTRVYTCPNDKGFARLGLTVSKRVSRKATARNRLKRQIRESFRNDGNDLDGIDVVVVACAGSAGATGEALRSSLANHWMKLGRR